MYYATPLTSPDKTRMQNIKPNFSEDLISCWTELRVNFIYLQEKLQEMSAYRYSVKGCLAVKQRIFTSVVAALMPKHQYWTRYVNLTSAIVALSKTQTIAVWRKWSKRLNGRLKRSKSYALWRTVSVQFVRPVNVAKHVAVHFSNAYGIRQFPGR